MIACRHRWQVGNALFSDFRTAMRLAKPSAAIFGGAVRVLTAPFFSNPGSWRLIAVKRDLSRHHIQPVIHPFRHFG